MTLEQKISYMDIALRANNITLAKPVLKVIIKTYDMVLEKEGHATLSEIIKINEEE
jgi:hypothetical protein